MGPCPRFYGEKPFKNVMFFYSFHYSEFSLGVVPEMLMD